MVGRTVKEGEYAMRTFDFSPLFRSTIGFDRMLDLLDQAVDVDTKTGYPPYNIEKTGDDSYRLSVAVAGFKPEELSVVSEGVTLTVSGEKLHNGGDHYLYQGIAGRSFKRKLQLAEYIKVEGAHLNNGLLSIDLKREVPEAMKPRTIPVAAMGMAPQAAPLAAVR
jgi:molecular chaperone IbpA